MTIWNSNTGAEKLGANTEELLSAFDRMMRGFAEQLASEVDALADDAFDDDLFDHKREPTLDDVTLGNCTLSWFDDPLTLHVFRNTRDTVTSKPYTVTYRDMLQQHFAEHRAAAEKDGLCTIGATFIPYTGQIDPNSKEGKAYSSGRMDVFVKSVTFIQFDFDNKKPDGRPTTFDDIVVWLQARGYAGYIYTTYSHSEAVTKFRVIVFFKSPFHIRDSLDDPNGAAREALYRRGYAHLAEDIGEPWDKTCANPSRLYFTPAYNMNEEDASKLCHVQFVLGDQIDFDAVVAKLPVEQPRKKQNRKASKVETRDREEFNEVWKFIRTSFNGASFALDYDETAKDRGEKVETFCPFDDEHGHPDKPDKTPVFWLNADVAKHGTATAVCQHESCKIEHKRTAGDFVFAVLDDKVIETLGEYIDDAAISERFQDWLAARPVTLEQCEDAIAAAIADNARGLDNLKVVAALNLLARFRDEVRLPGLIERLAKGVGVGVGRVAGIVKAQANKINENSQRAQAGDGDEHEQRPESDNDLPRGFMRRADGLYCNGERVCGKIELKRAARTDASEDWSLEFEITNAQNGKARVLIKNEDRSTAFNEVMGNLMSRGLWVSSNAIVQTEFRRLLNDWQTTIYDTLLKQPGFHSKGNAFTHLGGTIVKDGSGLDADRFVYNVPEKEQPRGMLDGWRKATSREFMLGEHRQCMALHTLWGVSSPVFHYAKHPSVSLHPYGSSGHGKTTSQAFQVSAWGRPETGSLLFPTMKATQNALEGALPRANNMTLAYDEAKTAEPKAVVGLGFTIAAEQYKSRLNTSGDEKPRPTWSGVTTSFSSEQSLEQFAAEARQTLVAGASVRALAISVAGIKKRDPHEVDRRVTMLMANYGVAGPALVKECWRRGFEPGCDEVAALVDAYALKLLGGGGDALRSRWGRHVKPFAIMGVAGELMVAAGILDWTNDDVLKIVRWGWETFLGGSAAQGSDVGKAGIAALKAYLVTHLGSTVVPRADLAVSRSYTGVIACYDAEYVYVFKHRIKDIEGLATDPETLIAALAAQDLLRLQGKNRVWTKGLCGDVAHIRVRWGAIDAVTVDKGDVAAEAAAHMAGKSVKVEKPGLDKWRRLRWRG